MPVLLCGKVWQFIVVAWPAQVLAVCSKVPQGTARLPPVCSKMPLAPAWEPPAGRVCFEKAVRIGASRFCSAYLLASRECSGEICGSGVSVVVVF